MSAHSTTPTGATSTVGRRNVLIILGDATARGGLQARWHRIAKHLAASRSVTILTWHPAPLVRRETAATGVPVISVPALTSWNRDHEPARARANTAASIATGTAGALALHRRWDVVIGVGLHPEGTVAAMAARLLRRPFMVDTWLTGPRGNAARLETSALRRPVMHLLRRATAVLGGTADVLDELRRLGLPSARLEQVNWGARTEVFRPASPAERSAARADLGIEHQHMIAFTGRFDLRQKRLDLLLDAWDGAGPAGWLLLLVGTGPDAEAVARRVATCKRPVAIRDWRDDPWMALRAADAFVLPTDFESPGIALFEGMSSGVPGLVSAIPEYRRLDPPGVTLIENQLDEWMRAIAALPHLAPNEEMRPWIEQRARESTALGVLDEILDRPYVDRR